MENNQTSIPQIPKEKFEFVKRTEKMHDEKLETKPVGYFKDAFLRFKKNKGAIVAAIIVILVILFSIIGPFLGHANYTEAYKTDTEVKNYQKLTPRLEIFKNAGFWDGKSSKKGVNLATYIRYKAIESETGYKVICKESTSFSSDFFDGDSTTYNLVVDDYHLINCFIKTLTQEQYEEIQAWQDENKLQVIMPYVHVYDKNDTTFNEGENKNLCVKANNNNIWYACDIKGNPVRADGTLITDVNEELVPVYYTYADAKGRNDNYNSSMRLENDPYLAGDTVNGWSYAQRTGTSGAYNYSVRVNAYNYFIYKYGFKPSFAFGTDGKGYDILTRLASGARFSMLFALAVSALNLAIGSIYGAIEGYYGGKLDLIMERISDILASIPVMVVAVLFNLHLAAKVGPVPALLYAFVLTGWIGMASRTRMQFYRYKNQEYVLAARTLGARDRRIIWKHIFPNSLGTLITGSVLVIPGVIFSETSLTYLGIINLDTPTRSSVGAMLDAGRNVMTSSPHIVLFPALFIAILMISFNLFGNGLRDAFNPSLRGSDE